jgi:uncharacterized protein (TIGR02145 family)
MSITKSYLVGIAIAFFLTAITCTKDPVGPGPVNITGTVVDIDGNVYTTVKIGKQEWMVENLRTTRYNDGTAIPLVTDSAEWSRLTTPGYCWYLNDINNKNKYGALYNWYTVNPENTKKLAPKGWHVPDTTEWKTLENYLIANGYNWDVTTTGNKIAKSLAAKTDWRTTTIPGTIGCDLITNNKCGFSSLPGGCRNSDGFSDQNYGDYWWSTTAVVAAGVWYHFLRYDRNYLGRNNAQAYVCGCCGILCDLNKNYFWGAYVWILMIEGTD